MPKYRVVTYSDPQDFVDACKPFDDSFLNFTLGSLLDSLNSANLTAKGADTSHTDRTMIAVFNGDQLAYVRLSHDLFVAWYQTIICRVTLIRIPFNFAWMLGTPHAEDSWPSEDVSVLMSLLVSAVATAVVPTAFDKVIGPENLVNILLGTWVNHMHESGTPVRMLDPFFKSRVSYATRSSLPPLVPVNHKIELATSKDIEILVPFFIDLTRLGPHTATIEAAQRFMDASINLGRVWLCRVDDQIAGYCAVGRMTPCTIAIRNLYVSPEYRRRGVGEALTQAVTRMYLGATPLGFDAPVLEGLVDVKREVCLNVVEEHVERIYKKCGFLLDQANPDGGKPGWFRSLFRGVEYL